MKHTLNSAGYIQQGRIYPLTDKCTAGMVQANVGQKLLNRNILKSFLCDQFRIGDATFR
jgi:hypothetical protein